MFEDDVYWSGKSATSSVVAKDFGNSATETFRITSSESKTIDYATIRSHINVHSLIKCYQQRGHLAADLDPLGITTVSIKDDHGIKRRADESVTKNYFDFTASDMDKEFVLPPSTFIGGTKKTLKLRFVLLLSFTS